MAQFFPQDAAQIEMITAAAMRAGFIGGVVVDYPHSTRAKKYYLCVSAGTRVGGGIYVTPKPLTHGEAAMDVSGDEDDVPSDFEESDSDGGEAAGVGGGVFQFGQNGMTVRNEEAVERGQRRLTRRERAQQRRKKPFKKSRGWVNGKKDSQRLQGEEVRHNSRYTARRRKRGFN